MRMRQSLNDLELAFEHETVLDRRRRAQLRHRAASRSRARRITRVEKSGKLRFSVLFGALTLTVIFVTVVMFETLALLVG